MELSDCIEKVSRTVRAVTGTGEGDYIGEDGLKYCGRCKTPKQTRLQFNNGRVVPCLCDCEAERLAMEEENRQRQEEIEKLQRLRKVGFPDADMQRYRFENDDGRSPEIITAAKAYVEQFDSMRQQGKGLLLYGPPGTGKTFAAACIINALMDRGVSGLCTSLSRIVNQLPAYDGRQEFIDGINQFSVIVLDDFGVERDTDYMSEQVHTIIDARYRSRKPLIVTTNLTGQDMRQAQEMRQERVLSRLFEMCTPIEVTGKDRRKEKLRQKYKNDRVALGLGK